MSWNRMCRHKLTGGLGFRDFRNFNSAMLGKLGWRFMSNPNSLVSRVYKDIYFYENNFLPAELGNNPSFIWRSIWEAKHVIVAGARWIIGPEENINIVGQLQLSNEQNPYVDLAVQEVNNYKVSSFVKTDERSWDTDIIHDMFNARDQRCILNTPIKTNTAEDQLYQSKENTDQYSV